MHYKTCEICGMKAGRVGGRKRTFMAKFPLDEDRCKRWVQVTGNEDLAYVPIEKLHELKYICGKHFRLRDFKKKMTQLKTNAVPSVLITAKPLPDEILMGFPLHIFEPSKSTAVTATVGMGTSDSTMLCGTNLSWMCRDHLSKMSDQLLRRLSLLLIRNECQIKNRSFAELEDPLADTVKKGQQQGISK